MVCLLLKEDLHEGRTAEFGTGLLGDEARFRIYYEKYVFVDG